MVVSRRPFLLLAQDLALVRSLANAPALQTWGPLVAFVVLRNGRWLMTLRAYSAPAEKDGHNRDRQKEDGIAGFERPGTPGPGQKTTEVNEENDSENEADHTSIIGDLQAFTISCETVEGSSRWRLPKGRLFGVSLSRRWTASGVARPRT